VNYFEFHIGDYAQATQHLSMLEDAAYSRMLRWCYANERPLPFDIKQIERLVRAQSKPEREAVSNVLSEFFVQMDDGWHQDRVDREIARYQDKQRKASASANARWKKGETHNEGNANAYANALQTLCEGNANQTPDTNKTPIAPLPGGETVASSPPGFDDFWQAYPRKVGKGAALTAWKRARVNGHLADVLAAITVQRSSEQWQRDGGRFVPNPATWLNQRRWEDETAPGAGPEGGGRDWI
jgi:uncharacterized protein YdaU (DUF1376 family)